MKASYVVNHLSDHVPPSQDYGADRESEIKHLVINLYHTDLSWTPGYHETIDTMKRLSVNFINFIKPSDKNVAGVPTSTTSNKSQNSQGVVWRVWAYAAGEP
ncbi:hypothetical protein F5Y16DRAFT_333151 [Xylariaceae sp. FL0255]|nr:hypothetical protein F5Y16DRAFT_333151 [Xylariaceae sp. FL0255]